MNADQLLTDTFAAHESLAPQADETWREIQDRIDHPRVLTGSRVLVGATGVAAVAAVAITATVIGQQSNSSSDGSAAASSSIVTTLVTPPRVAKPAPDFLTIAAGWLPHGTAAQVVAANGYASQVRGYDVANGPGSNYVLIGLDTATTLPTTNKRGAPVDLTIAGRPAREWSVDNHYHLAILRPDGHVASVDVEAQGPADTLATIGRHVGADLQFGRHDALAPAFRVSVLPTGQAIRALSVDPENGTIYTVAAPTASVEADPTLTIATESTTSTVTGKPAPPTTPGRPVQGHQTTLVGGSAHPSLTIVGALPGKSITLTSASLSLEQLYGVADGLIL